MITRTGLNPLYDITAPATGSTATSPGSTSSTNSTSGTTGTTGTSSTASGSDTVLTDAAGGALGENAFLQMLVTEMQNQDPLNPMDGKDLAVQLAQFSSVEQLISANSKLDTISQALTQVKISPTSTSGSATSGTTSSSGTSSSGDSTSDTSSVTNP